MISNKLYERLVDEGIIDQEFPEEIPTPIQKVVQTLPSTLQEKAEKILTALCDGGFFHWNPQGEIWYDHILYPKSNISELTSSLVHRSSKFYKLEAADVFLSALKRKVPASLFTTPIRPQENIHSLFNQKGNGQKNRKLQKSSWITFEEIFKFKK